MLFQQFRIFPIQHRKSNSFWFVRNFFKILANNKKSPLRACPKRGQGDSENPSRRGKPQAERGSKPKIRTERTFLVREGEFLALTK
jgi:hypothetical protein